MHLKQILIRSAIISFLSWCTFHITYAQNINQEYLRELKEDKRGPYKDIKWFCEDGTVREARDPCPEPLKGVQHARYKDKITALAEKEHIFLDQILTGEEYDQFWDAKNQNSRLKQYQITNFLYEADNGWILQQAKNYRGAKQIEDEQEWGQEFLEWTTNSDSRLRDNYLLIRLAAEDVPHGEDNRTSQKVRAYSKLLADQELSFMEWRIKIHNNPSKSDLLGVKQWREKNASILNTEELNYLNNLVDNMEVLYTPFDMSELKDYSRYLPKDSDIKKSIDDFAANHENSPARIRAMATCVLLKDIRDNIYDTKWREARVKMLDLSNHLEEILIQDLSIYEAHTLSEIRDKICYLTDGLYGAGYLEQWEYVKVKEDIDWLYGARVSMEHLDHYRFATQKILQWSTQMVQSLYAEPLQRFNEFEPLVYGFTDDKIRSSLVLPMGRTVEKLNTLFNNTMQSSSMIMGDNDVSGIQGLNPGIAKGVLTVLTEITENMELDANKIYAFDRPPADLKPVAGILNVKEGNPVSHVQLLARNLAIPNALITGDLLKDLQKFNGEEVFYAVSPKGTIVLKLIKDMNDVERKLFDKKKRQKDRITISTEKIILDPDSLLNMSKIDASFSGKWCGPKAANLGQLKVLFPDNVVEGVIIPFGIFKDHMEQNIPGIGESYWQYLKRIFRNEKNMLLERVDLNEIECITLQELEFLRSKIEEMPLKKSLVSNLENNFKEIFGKSIGSIPVFLRSDTNMEDLPEFTGAGLNLTLFNIVDRDQILKGIKQVWASPYTDRSYQWRQQYLENPEDVYPSILIIPSVNVDKSGVIITKGISRGSDEDMSISFSKGVGGAVEGQSAESYIVYNKGYSELISPGRETKYRTIPTSGGSTYAYTTFIDPVLENQDLLALKQIADRISKKMDETVGEYGPYDIELGIKDDKIWLFQVRPFVENKSAISSSYLTDLDPQYENKYLALDEQ